jgi:hypothetical protein
MGQMKVRLEDGRAESFVTVERPWLGNKPFESCIPEGVYTVKRHVSPKFGVCFKVQDVHNRTHILFHVGNTKDDVVGCIAVGTMFGSSYSILQSKIAMNRLLDTIKEDEFTLTISAFRAEYP